MAACFKNFGVCEDRINVCYCLNTGIVLTVLLVILLLIVLVLRKRIQIAIAMIKEASKYVRTLDYKLEQTPLNRSQQLPVAYKRLTDRLEEN